MEWGGWDAWTFTSSLQVKAEIEGFKLQLATHSDTLIVVAALTCCNLCITSYTLPFVRSASPPPDDEVGERGGLEGREHRWVCSRHNIHNFAKFAKVTVGKTTCDKLLEHVFPDKIGPFA